MSAAILEQLNPFKGYDYTKELEPVSLKWFLPKFVFGLITWIPFAIFAFAIPLIGWLFIPLVPIWPIAYPFIERLHIQRKQKKMKEQEEIMFRAMQRNKSK